MASKRKTVITFDIDGTICKQGGHGPGDKMMHTLAFNHAYKKVFGVDANISEVKHAGSTDQLILLHVLLNRGFDKSEVVAKMPELKQAMVEYAEANSETAGEGLELLPGVEATLKALQKREDVRVGLVTGNLEPIAWMKMRALGIHGYFSEPNFGGCAIYTQSHASLLPFLSLSFSLPLFLPLYIYIYLFASLSPPISFGVTPSIPHTPFCLESLSLSSHQTPRSAAANHPHLW